MGSEEAKTMEQRLREIMVLIFSWQGFEQRLSRLRRWGEDSWLSMPSKGRSLSPGEESHPELLLEL